MWRGKETHLMGIRGGRTRSNFYFRFLRLSVLLGVSRSLSVCLLIVLKYIESRTTQRRKETDLTAIRGRWTRHIYFGFRRNGRLELQRDILMMYMSAHGSNFIGNKLTYLPFSGGVDGVMISRLFWLRSVLKGGFSYSKIQETKITYFRSFHCGSRRSRWWRTFELHPWGSWKAGWQTVLPHHWCES
jgi:hypothetical protein